MGGMGERSCHASVAVNTVMWSSVYRFFEPMNLESVKCCDVCIPTILTSPFVQMTFAEK